MKIKLESVRTGKVYEGVDAYQLDDGSLVIRHSWLNSLFNQEMEKADRPNITFSEAFDLRKFGMPDGFFDIAIRCDIEKDGDVVSEIGEMTSEEYAQSDPIKKRNPIATARNRAFDKAFILYMLFKPDIESVGMIYSSEVIANLPHDAFLSGKTVVDAISTNSPDIGFYDGGEEVVEETPAPAQGGMAGLSWLRPSIAPAQTPAQTPVQAPVQAPVQTPAPMPNTPAGQANQQVQQAPTGGVYQVPTMGIPAPMPNVQQMPSYRPPMPANQVKNQAGAYQAPAPQNPQTPIRQNQNAIPTPGQVKMPTNVPMPGNRPMPNTAPAQTETNPAPASAKPLTSFSNIVRAYFSYEEEVSVVETDNGIVLKFNPTTEEWTSDQDISGLNLQEVYNKASAFVGMPLKEYAGGFGGSFI